MKRTSFILVLFAVGITAMAQSVRFAFEAGTADYASFSKMSVESTISQLLTEINRADRMNTSLNLSGINMEAAAKEKFMKFWSNMHLTCEDNENVQKCLQDAQGYQVRNIPVTLHPLDNSYRGSVEKTIVISLNKRGQISGVRTALDRQNYKSIMETGKVVTDERQRREILKFVEDLRFCYYIKDIKSLRKILIDDFGITSYKIAYKQHIKEEHLNRLQQFFNSKNFVDVDFDKILVKQCGAAGKERFYGITLKQKWYTDRYSDESYLFFLLELMDNGNPPVILFRVWQPAKYPDGTPLKDDDIVDIHDFILP